MIKIQAVTGKDLLSVVSRLAELRIQVFREWPYLYEGSAEYEARYLTGFATSEAALVVLAIDGNEIVGASTAAPLCDHTESFAPAFSEKGLEPSRVYYFGESILLPAYRGRGVGKVFFEQREAHARALGIYEIMSFCAVVRAHDDERRPQAYRELEPFWNRMGFRKVEGLIASLDWQEIGGDETTVHQMQFWAKPL